MLKYEQTVNIQVNPRKNAFFRIFCELPAKIGSIIRIKQGHLRGYSRNECCPCEGIDTHLRTSINVQGCSRNECCPCEGIDTLCFPSYPPYPRHVEMSVARVRALTLAATLTLTDIIVSRNECCPCEGIDTILQPYYS